MELYGLIGKTLAHSFSPNYFNNKFQSLKIDAEYRLFEMDDPSEILLILKRNKSLKGLNVTIPFKKRILAFLDIIDPEAQNVGAVNTIKIDRVGDKHVLSGFNTDTLGIEASLKPLIIGRSRLSALILGSGGSAHSVAYVLSKMNIPYQIVSRQKAQGDTIFYDDINPDLIKKNKLIINTTPLGMFPNIDTAPQILYEFLTRDHTLFDLIYNPGETLFLKKGNIAGATILNGLDLLIKQAEEAWKIWQQD